MGTLRSRIGDPTGVEYPIEMYATGLHFDVLLVFFVYGLAFVLMGLAIALESGRTPALAGKGLLHPLAAFGVLHGAHEWLELFLMQIVWFGETYPTWTGWFRVVLLTASFTALIIYGIEAFRLPRHRLEANSIVYLGVLFIYLIAILTAVILTGRPEGQSDFGFYDTLIRYFMAVPGAALAGWGLRAQSLQARDQGRRHPDGAIVRRPDESSSRGRNPLDGLRLGRDFLDVHSGCKVLGHEPPPRLVGDGREH